MFSTDEIGCQILGSQFGSCQGARRAFVGAKKPTSNDGKGQTRPLKLALYFVRVSVQDADRPRRKRQVGVLLCVKRKGAATDIADRLAFVSALHFKHALKQKKTAPASAC